MKQVAIALPDRACNRGLVHARDSLAMDPVQSREHKTVSDLFHRRSDRPLAYLKRGQQKAPGSSRRPKIMLPKNDTSLQTSQPCLQLYAIMEEYGRKTTICQCKTTI